MPFFGESASPYDEVVERATHSNTADEDWGLILGICDKVRAEGPKGVKHVLLSLKKRLNHRDPHVVLLALSVLDSCMSNCGLPFQQAVCSKEFLSELKAKATYSNRSVGEKTRSLLKKWAGVECKSEPSLSLIPTLVDELKRDGYSFESADPPKKQPKIPSDPNYVSSKEEEDAIAKAIQASLKDAPASSSSVATSALPMQNGTSMYPTTGGISTTSSHRTVKALYDFEAAEDNELTFKSGDLITVLDDSDINWWKGSNQGGVGLFPSSFVTSDLSANTVDPSVSNEKRKSVQFDENVTVKQLEPEPTPEEPPVRIDEALLNECLETLRDADPTGDTPDPPHLPAMEERCHAQGPLIDADLAEVDRQHNLLAEVDVKIRDALALYDAAMQDATKQFQAQVQPGYTSQQPQMNYGQMGPTQPQVQYITGADGQPMMVQNGVVAGYSLPQPPPQTTYAYAASSLPPQQGAVSSHSYAPYAVATPPQPTYTQ